MDFEAVEGANIIGSVAGDSADLINEGNDVLVVDSRTGRADFEASRVGNRSKEAMASVNVVASTSGNTNSIVEGVSEIMNVEQPTGLGIQSVERQAWADATDNEDSDSHEESDEEQP
ncbi:hypothetical protein NE237_018020 [Protea cynaroides]|uniref:Uncharacterized protein n=1 Tax=Protea cynaroides TaxID=273540 RepID=A0A9Q0K987_9MAGN|nr:hypothetical protein NE237_018020 [Protea cynaroides]